MQEAYYPNLMILELPVLCITLIAIVCISETWLDETISNHELCLENFDIVQRDRNRQGGGTLIYINNCYSHSLVFSGSDDLELIVLAVNNSVFRAFLPPS
jgi:hypothetical protein